MGKLLRIVVFLLFPVAAFSQYTNSWINYNQPYYKFPILQDGVYSITYDALVNSGIPVNTIDPRNIQLFGRGEELYIYVSGESDGSFDPGDYIEFYAQRNDGYFDVDAYDQPSSHGNPYYSLFNDTARYFLSWGNQQGLRMSISTDTDISTVTPATYFLKENSVYYINSGYRFGETYSIVGGTTNPQYTPGEGYYSAPFAGSFSASVSTPSATSGPSATLKANVVGIAGNNAAHSMRVTVGSFSATDTYNGFAVNNFDEQVAASNISNSGTTNVAFASLNGTNNMLAYASLKYPHGMNLPPGTTNYSKMFVPDNPNQNKTLLNLTNFTNTGGRLFDLTNHRRIALFTNGGANAVLVPNGGGEKECYLTSDAQIAANTIPVLKPVGTDQTGYFLDISNYLVPPNFYIITHKSLWSTGQNYKLYRNQSGYRAELFDIEEIYDQFGHGIAKSPMGIRHFADFAYHQWGPDTMQHLLLLGKSIYPYQCRTSVSNYANSLVPSFGYPTCDMLITAGLGGNLYEPAIPVGRVAAKTDIEASYYLDKVVSYEGQEPAEWRKRVMHFCGGSDGNENDLLCFYVNGFKNIIEDSLYGAWVQTFSKTNSQPFQITQSDSIRELIEDGVSLMTFFGHGSGGGFDVNTDDVNTYNIENGRYPLIFGNSCLSGDIHNIPGSSLSMSEPWVLHNDGGAIGFIASVGVGLTSALNIYGTNFYRNLSLNKYHSTIGNVMKQTVADLQQPNNYLINFTLMQTTLHGDPGLKINTHPLPDLSVQDPVTLSSETHVYFTNPQGNGTPITVTTELDSFDVNIIINNFGRTYDDTLILYVRRSFPGNVGFQEVTKTFAPIYFKDTVSVRFATSQISGIGINQLYVHVDDGPFPVISELSEQNNFINNLNFVVQSPDIIPVYPYKFAIMGAQGITLKASTGDPFAPSKTYKLQLDTTDRFNSPLLQETTITQSGGVVNWTPTLLANMPDSTVYFWRASLDPTLYPTTYKWRESSFQYIPNKYGWGQSHFFQFKPDGTPNTPEAGYEGDKYQFVEHNRPFRRFDFISTPKSVSVHNIGWPTTINQGYEILWKIDSEIEDYIACGGNFILTPQLIVAVIDNNTLEPWGTPGYDPPPNGPLVNQDHAFGQMNNFAGSCGRSRPWKMFLWNDYDDVSMSNLSNFLTTIVPDSFYVLIYSWLPSPAIGGAGTYRDWDNSGASVASVKAALQNSPKFEFNALDTIPLNYPWAFFAQKGKPSSTSFLVGDAPTAVIDFNATMIGTFNKGTITTPLIGPSAGWNWMYWDRHPSEIPTDDTLNFKVTGVRFNGIEDEVISYFQAYPQNGGGPDSLQLTNLIDHTVYPYIKLTAFTQDDTTRTPTQMERWQILYDQVPEAALNPNIGYEFLSPEVEQFQDILFKTAIENIGDYDMDSLLVKYWVQNSNNQITLIDYPRQAPLLIDDVLIDQVTVPTGTFTGNNKLWVEVNPYDSLGRTDQLEQYHFNNIGYVQFTVNGDRINPILDVTFDGIHILDGDIVSARPFISMTVDDENPYLILNEQSDTSKIKVFLIKPGSSTPERVWFDGFNTMQFIPATAPENKFKIEYPAVFAEDGVYRLIVQGSDKSNNNSGSFEYTISFEVINRSTITEVLNYPNPFSTSTRFVFVLTGSVIPDYFKIQIMTITGKVVREITTDELGPVNIGRNITQYAWNGKDEYGDQLANGVYLYTVTAYINGQDIEHRNSGADKYFHKDFGKMFLMR